MPNNSARQSRPVKTLMVWTCRKNDRWPNSTHCTARKIRMKKKQRQNKTVLDRQYKRGHGVNWTDTEESNGLDKGRRTMEVIYLYPSPPKWLVSVMTMMIYAASTVFPGTTQMGLM